MAYFPPSVNASKQLFIYSGNSIKKFKIEMSSLQRSVHFIASIRAAEQSHRKLLSPAGASDSPALSAWTVEEKWVIREKWWQQMGGICHCGWLSSETSLNNKDLGQNKGQTEKIKDVWLWDGLECFPSRFLVGKTCCHLGSLGQPWHCSCSVKTRAAIYIQYHET